MRYTLTNLCSTIREATGIGVAKVEGTVPEVVCLHELNLEVTRLRDGRRHIVVRVWR